MLCDLQTGYYPVPYSLSTIRLDATSIDKLKCLLLQFNRSPWLECHNVDKATKYFIDRFKIVLIKACPLSSQQARRYFKPKKLWIRAAVLSSIQTKFYLFKKFLADPTSKNQAKFWQYGNCLTKLLWQAKQLHYLHKFQNAERSPKRLNWLLMNALRKRNWKTFRKRCHQKTRKLLKVSKILLVS